MPPSTFEEQNHGNYEVEDDVVGRTCSGGWDERCDLNNTERSEKVWRRDGKNERRPQPKRGFGRFCLQAARAWTNRCSLPCFLIVVYESHIFVDCDSLGFSCAFPGDGLMVHDKNPQPDRE